MTNTTSQAHGLGSSLAAGARMAKRPSASEGDGTSFAQLFASQMSEGKQSTMPGMKNDISVAKDDFASQAERRLAERREMERKRQTEEKNPVAMVPTHTQTSNVTHKEQLARSSDANAVNQQKEVAKQKSPASGQEDSQAVKTTAEKTERVSDADQAEVDQMSAKEGNKTTLGEGLPEKSSSGLVELTDAATVMDDVFLPEEGADFVRIFRDADGQARVSADSMKAIDIEDIDALTDRQISEKLAALLDSTAKTRQGVRSAANGMESFAAHQQAKYDGADNRWSQTLFDPMSMTNTGQAYSGSFSDLLSSGFGQQSFLSGAAAEVGDDVEAFSQWLDQKLQSATTVGLNMPIARESVPGAGTATTMIKEALGESQWTNALGERVEWIVNQRVQKATILLNPANLGPIEVSLSMEGGKTHAVFVTQNPAVREAIEASLPQLEQMLANVGVSLGGANVSEESFSSQAGKDGSGGTKQQMDKDGIDSSVYVSSLDVPEKTKGLFGKTMQWVDTFA